jgi:MYXO-CTERM domain-containing protein
MKRLSRHTVVVLLVALGVCLGGMSLAVGAFGQSGGNPDATVPLGDYTQTTPATSTQPLSSYTTTTPTTTPTDTGAGQPVSTNDTKPETTHGRRDVNMPSKATRSGPTHLAFTGGEPIIIGAAGAGLMLAGLVLHRRRRQHPAA